MRTQVIAEGYLVVCHLGRQVWMVGPMFVVKLSSLPGGGGGEGVQYLQMVSGGTALHPIPTCFRMCVNAESWVRWVLGLLQ